MKREIVVDIDAHQTRVALLENDEMAEIYIERTGRERLVGNIYKGCVANVLPGMQAAFVDIGLEKNAFLYAGDISVDKSDFVFPYEGRSEADLQLGIKDIVKQGQEIILQVLKEPVGTKGARVTTHITLPGRTLVLMPTVNYIGVSRRIEDEEERVRLREIIERIKPSEMGVIVRTAAAGKSEEEFAEDIRFLVRLWERVQQRGRLVRAPRLIHGEEPLIFRTIRDIFTPDISRLIINDEEYYERVKVVAGITSPELQDRVELYQGNDSLFDHYNLESQIDRLLQRKVWLKNGGYIVIDQTEALTAIDVNTGKYVGSDNLQQTLFETNCEAAKEIARQLRLRDISGIIIIDFIDMEEQENRDALIELLRSCLKKDRTKSNVLGMTGLGLIEMTRKKVRKPLAATLQCTCPCCQGEGKLLSEESVALRVGRQLKREFQNTDCKTFLIEVSSGVGAFIENGASSGHPILPRKEGREVYMRSIDGQHVEEFRILSVTDPKMLEGNGTVSRLWRQR